MGTIWIDPDTYGAYVAATSPVTLSGTQTIDSVAVAAGKVVLVTAQSDPTADGPYVCRAGAWDRVVPLTAGQSWVISAGTSGAGKIYQLVTPAPIIPGTTALTIAAAVSGTVTPSNLGTITDGITLDQSGAGGTLQVAGCIAVPGSTVTLAKQGGLYLLNWGAGTTVSVPDATAPNGAQWDIFTRGFAVSVASVSGTANIAWNGVTDTSTKSIGSTLWAKVRIVKMSSGLLRVYAEPSVGEVTAPPPSGGWGSRVVFPGEATGVAAAGPVALSGTRVGQSVLAVFGRVISSNLVVSPATAAAAFESAITINNQVQQTSGSDLSGNSYFFILGA